MIETTEYAVKLEKKIPHVLQESQNKNQTHNHTRHNEEIHKADKLLEA